MSVEDSTKLPTVAGIPRGRRFASLWQMLRTLVVVAMLGGLHDAAFAEPETVEQELRALAIPEQPGRGFHAAAFAQLVGGSASGDDASVSEGAAAIGGDLRYSGSRCDYIRVGGQARVGYRDGRRATAEQWASACIPIFIMEVGHHLEWDVRPSLLAPLEMRAGTNRRETVSFRWQPLRARLGHLLAAIERGEARKQGIKLADPIDPNDSSIPSGDAVVFDTHVEAVFLWSPHGELVMQERAEVVPFAYIKQRRAPWGAERDFVVEVGTGGGEFVGGDVGATIRIWGVRLQNLKLGPVFATAGIGLVSGGVGPFVEEYTREVDITDPRAVLGIETGGSMIHGHLRATHDVSLVADGYITVDSRLTAGIGADSRKTRLSLDGAIARTEVHVPGAMPVARVTGGGSLSLAHHLTPHLDAMLQLDVARSFYAANVTQLDFVPRWGAYLFAGIQARVGR